MKNKTDHVKELLISYNARSRTGPASNGVQACFATSIVFD